MKRMCLQLLLSTLALAAWAQGPPSGNLQPGGEPDPISVPIPIYVGAGILLAGVAALAAKRPRR